MGETSQGGEGEWQQDPHGPASTQRMSIRLPVQLLDQGLSETCTVHALSHAVSEHLASASNIQVSLEECLGALKQLEMVEVMGGNHVMDFQGVKLRNRTDQRTGAYGTVKIQVSKVFKKGCQHVLVYDLVESDPSSKHCAFVKGCEMDNGIPMFSCINSWGPKDPEPKIKVTRPGNMIYFIEATWLPIEEEGEEKEIGTDILQRVSNISPVHILILTVTFFGKVV